MDSPCWKCTPHPDCTDGCPKIAEWERDKERAKAFPILAEILRELDRAEGLHKTMVTKSHARGVVDEEYDEVMDELSLCRNKLMREFRAEKSENLNAGLRRELIHLACVCVRTLKDLGDSQPVGLMGLGEK